ncbi:MAG: response regulator [Bacteroidales bacterium]|nr:response regulator [Bacteroidales bacterium]
MNRHIRYRIALIAALMLSCLGLAAEEQDFSNLYVRSFRAYQANTSLTSDVVNCLALDDYGRLWVGAKSGFSIHSNGEYQSYSLFEIGGERYFVRSVNSIVVGPSAVIATNEMLLNFDWRNNKFTEIRYKGEHIIASAMRICAGKTYIFSCTEQKILVYDFASGTLKDCVDCPPHSEFAFESMEIVSEEGPVLLMAQTGKGVFEVNVESGDFRRIEVCGTDVSGSSLFLDENGVMWLGVSDKGLVGYNTKKSYAEFIRFSPVDFSRDAARVVSIGRFPSGVLLVSVDGEGLFLISVADKTVDPFVEHRAKKAGCICVINDKEFFFGTKNIGLLCVKKMPVVRYIPGLSVKTVFQSRDGSVWAVRNVNSTNAAALFRFDEKNRSIKPCRGTDNLEISSVCSLDENTLLLLVSDEGLYEYGINTDRAARSRILELPSPVNTEEMILSNNSLGDVLVLSNVGNSYCYRPSTGELRQFSIPHAVKDASSIVDVANTDNGRTIITTKNSILELDQDLWIRELFHSDRQILSSAMDPMENIWYLTIKGLNCYSIRENKNSFEYASNRDNTLARVCIDRTGYNKLWIQTFNDGMLVYTPLTGERRILTLDDGLISSNSPTDGGFCSESGVLYFPGGRGLAVLFPENENDVLNPFKLDVHLLSVTEDGRPVKIDTLKKRVRISRKHALVRMNLVVEGDSPSIHNLVYYHLYDNKGKLLIDNPLDKSEIDLGCLSPGTYTLKIVKLVRDEVTSPEQLLTIAVRRPFGMGQFLAWTGTILLFFLLVSGILRLRRYRKLVKRQNIIIHSDTNEIARANRHIFFLINKLISQLSIPLSEINNSLLKEAAKDSEPKEGLKNISHCVDNINANLVALNPERVNPYARPLYVEPIVFNRVIENVINDFRIESISKNVIISFTASKNISQVNLDRSLFELSVNMVLRDMVTNIPGGLLEIFSYTASPDMVGISFKTSETLYEGSPENLLKPFNSAKDQIPFFGVAISKVPSIIGRMMGKVKMDTANGFSLEILLPTSLIDTSDSFQKQMGPNDVLCDPMKSGLLDPRHSTMYESILVVNSSEDVLEYFRQEYKHIFNRVLTAEDGLSALKVIMSEHPSIVFCDEDIPKMDGFSLCNEIKTKLNLSHIPIVLRTSQLSMNNRDMGYKTTADLLISKSMDAGLIFDDLKSVIVERYRLRHSHIISLKEDFVIRNTYSIADEKMMLRLNRFIESNASDARLNTDMIASEIGISEETLNSKLIALWGMSAGRYLRSARVCIAKDLLVKSKHPLDEVAALTGFTSVKNLEIIFFQETGFSPKMYKSQSL